MLEAQHARSSICGALEEQLKDEWQKASSALGLVQAMQSPEEMPAAAADPPLRTELLEQALYSNCGPAASNVLKLPSGELHGWHVTKLFCEDLARKIASITKEVETAIKAKDEWNIFLSEKFRYCMLLAEFA